jgi:hypothetical protein
LMPAFIGEINYRNRCNHKTKIGVIAVYDIFQTFQGEYSIRL